MSVRLRLAAPRQRQKRLATFDEAQIYPKLINQIKLIEWKYMGITTVKLTLKSPSDSTKQVEEEF